MKRFRLVLLVLAATSGLLRAQDEERRAPPVEIPDFSNLDEYIYEPKSIVTLSARRLSGAKTSFFGQGRISAPEDPGAATGANLDRVYHNGRVQPDARVAVRLDVSGNPIIDSGSGSPLSEPIAPDGKTNTWAYTDASQLTADGYVSFSSYSATVTDTTVRTKDSGSSFGMELGVSRDMGNLFGSRFPWSLTAGVSLNDINASTSSPVQAQVRTLTDYYSLYGATPPGAPYSAPSSSSTTLLDAAGNALINDSGVTQTATTDTTVLLGNEPAGRTVSTAANATSVTNRWKLKGAYYTFRAGPTLWIPISTRLRASLSAGAAIVYSGSTYSVTQTFQPESGNEITDTSTNAAYKLLPGYYADASLQFNVTELTGFYAGAVFQSAGSYTQTMASTSSSYATKIDLSNQTGLRAGMAIRF